MLKMKDFFSWKSSGWSRFCMDSSGCMLHGLSVLNVLDVLCVLEDATLSCWTLLDASLHFHKVLSFSVRPSVPPSLRPSVRSPSPTLLQNFLSCYLKSYQQWSINRCKALIDQQSRELYYQFFEISSALIFQLIKSFGADSDDQQPCRQW